jgi:hypothetical protein
MAQHQAQRPQRSVAQKVVIEVIGLTTFFAIFVLLDHLTGWIGVF